MKTELEWVDSEVAKTWPEGILVLIWRPDRNQTSSGFVEVCQWFRPDWLASGSGYYLLKDKTLFAKLNLPPA
jgi:hypothetical protein